MKVVSVGSNSTGFFQLSQTTALFGALFIAFIFFITMTGDLKKWIAIFGL